jgi:hypothetical protein
VRLKTDPLAVDNPTVMSAGESAREQAKRLSEASDVHERKAERATRVSANFTAGAAGEEALAEAFAPLTARGWHPLYDRASPNGGNIDLVAVGPAGVAVIDAKAWTGTVTIDGTKLLLNGHSRAKDLNGVHRQVAEVEAAIRDAELVDTVRGFVALAGEQDRNRPSETVEGIRVLGMDQLVEKFSCFEQRFTTVEVETTLRAISLAFPPAGGRDQGKTSTSGTEGSIEPTSPRVEALIAGQLRFYYVRQSRNRLYLKDDHGTDLGWKDTISGEVTLTCAGDNAKLAQAILKAATPTGVPLAAGVKGAQTHLLHIRQAACRQRSLWVNLMGSVPNRRELLAGSRRRG